MSKYYRRRRMGVVLVGLLIMLSGAAYDAWQQRSQQAPAVQGVVTTQQIAEQELALTALEKLQVKGRAPKTGYDRDLFSSGWGEINDCSVRELVLQRDMENEVLHEDGCRVMSGTLQDPYTGKELPFLRGPTTSDDVQIDHVVAVSDAWQKGAQQLSPELRYQFYNDSLNLLAVDGPTNNKKSDGDAATWLPPNKDYRCRYVARQIAVKLKYSLWVVNAEHDAMKRVLTQCPEQVLPITDADEG